MQSLRAAREPLAPRRSNEVDPKRDEDNPALEHAATRDDGAMDASVAVSPAEAASVAEELETHRFGMYRTLKPVTMRDVLAARPRPIFRFIYPAICAITVVLVVVYWIS